MGNQKQYIDSGGFSEYLYKQVDETIYFNGLKGKIVEHIEGCHKGLPLYSNTSDIYLKKNKDGKVIQCRVYLDRKSFIDFDWGHEHKNSTDNRVFKQGVVHVQKYILEKGTPVRDSSNARCMSNAEMKKYGDLIKKVCPSAKLR